MTVTEAWKFPSNATVTPEFSHTIQNSNPVASTTISQMVQGKTKGLTSKASSTRHAAKAAANTKKGKKYVAPKKAILVKQASMHKVSTSFLGLTCAADIVYSQDLTAKINKSIEKQMVSAASSGKLTIMKNVAPEE